MKKFLIIAVTAALICSCAEYQSGYSSESCNGAVKVENVTVVDESTGWSIREITYNGETHEYVVRTGDSTSGIAHWEGCKYCKQGIHVKY